MGEIGWLRDARSFLVVIRIMNLESSMVCARKIIVKLIRTLPLKCWVESMPSSKSPVAVAQNRLLVLSIGESYYDSH